MPTVDQLLVKIDASTELLRRELQKGDASVRQFADNVEGRLGKFDRSFSALAKSARLATGLIGASFGSAAIVGGIRQATQSAAEFGQTLDRMVGLAGVSRDEIGGFRQEILRLSSVTGRGPKELSEALFFIASSGAKGATALDILEKSAQAARAGLGETRTVADALTSAINAYGVENLSAAEATDALVAAVRDGKAEASDLASSISVVIPIASRLKVSFQDVLAASAALTQIGSSASQSTTAIVGIFNALIKQSSKGAEVLEGVGSSYDKLIQILRTGGLPALLAEVNRLFGDNIAQLGAVFGRVEGLTALLALTGENADQVAQIFERVRHSTESLGTAIGAVADQPMDRMNRAQAEMEATSIRLGDAVLPALATAYGALADAISRTFEAAEKLQPRELLNLDVATQQQKIAKLSQQLREAREGGGGLFGLSGPAAPEVVSGLEEQLARERALLDDLRRAVATNNPAIINTVNAIQEQTAAVQRLQEQVNAARQSAINPSRLNPFAGPGDTAQKTQEAQRALDRAEGRLDELRDRLAGLYEETAAQAAKAGEQAAKAISDGLREIEVPKVEVPIHAELFGPTRADLGLPEDAEFQRIKDQLASIHEAALRSQGKVEEAIRASAERQIEGLRRIAREAPAVSAEVEAAIRDINARTEAEIKKIGDAAAETANKSSEFAQAFSAAFESRGMDALLNGDIHNALRGFVKDIIELIFRLTVLKPLADAIEKSLSKIGKKDEGGGGNGFLSGAAGILGAILGSRETGGPVTAGEPYVVGEKEPELYVRGKLRGSSVVGRRGREIFVPPVDGEIVTRRQLERAVAAGARVSARDLARSIPRRGFGGPAPAGRPLVVGDRREAELFVPDHGGKIVAMTKASASRSQAAPQVVVHAPINVQAGLPSQWSAMYRLAGEEAALQLRETMRAQQRNQR